MADLGADAVVRSEPPPETARRGVWADVGYMFRLLGFHMRRDPWIAASLWILVLGGGMVGSVVQVRFIKALAEVTNGLVAHDRSAVLAALGVAVVCIVLTAVHLGLSQALANALRLRIRTALTVDLLGRWLGGSRLYSPSPDHQIDHPEQRVQEDVYNFAMYLIQFAPLIVGTVTAFFLYSGQLWLLASPTPVDLPMVGTVVVPKALYLLAIAIAVTATISAHLVGRIYTRLEVVRQRLEAGFRHDMGQAREFAEQIVLGGGQANEDARARHDYALIQRNWWPLTGAVSSLYGLRGLFTLLTTVTPTVVLFPMVLDGRMKVGDLAIAGAAFGAVYQALGAFSSSYDTFALLRSAAQRIRLMDGSLNRLTSSGIVRIQESGSAFEVADLIVSSSDGTKLFSLPRLTIGEGERWLVRGMSGAGKSTFFRVMAGIWPFGSGCVSQPAGRSVMFLPQKPYLPNGTLAELLSYPEPSAEFSDDAYTRALKAARLEGLADRIGEARSWAKTLSPGEQQRVVLARALLRKPDFLFLDEATSSLDPTTEAAMFDAITRRMPGTTLITIAHTDRVASYHTHQLTIADGWATVGNYQSEIEA
ncbi:ABC transporter ATP-binding protein/permease [Sphingomonas sp. RIT328]|uniref:ABC transporter ATP-binding protein/permease n=1 Tax=Sphingomonas sp. RIT328 TaxID=1470591 RepID=UPI001376D6EA|nr:ATP-binding cassette domain-containing protein [Sphingomonas sp. RIT328]